MPARHAHRFSRCLCTFALLGAVGGTCAVAALRADDPPAPAPATPPATPPAPTLPSPPANPPAATPTTATPATTEPGPDAPEAVLLMKDGQQFQGFLMLRDEKQVVLRIGGIDTKFDASTVDRCEILPPVTERYRELRAAIDENDAEQIARLIEWLIARNQLDLAAREADALVLRLPGDPSALRARERVQAQLDLRTRPASTAPGTRGADGASQPLKPAPLPAATPDLVPLLRDDQINLIRVFEVDLSRPPRIEVPREVITKLIEQFAGHPSVPTSREGRDGLYRAKGSEQLDLIFKLRAREFYTQVRVLDNPEPIRIFRDDVQRTWLTNSCATTACHGGTEAGRLILATRKPASDAATYTNLLILDRFRMADGTPLIDHGAPEKSALLHLALGRDQAAIRHPVVFKGEADQWKPVFRKTDDRRYQQALTWIKGMYRPRPEYPVEYTPARPFTAPKPAETPQGR
ncbi:MAG: hypothetical protein ACT4PL_06460 [Phycisphaerales bacterium]